MSIKTDIAKIREIIKPKTKIIFVRKESEIDESRTDVIWVLFTI